MKNYFYSVLLVFILLSLFSFQSGSSTAPQLVAQMLEAGKKVQTLKFTMHKQERINGKMVAERSAVKLQQKPLKVYLKQEAPSAGMEVLYVHGQNNNEALVRPASFPWTTLSLNPLGSTVRSGQHHTIHDMGFSQILTITDFMLDKYGEKANSMLKLNGTTTWNNLTCYQVTLENPNFKWVDHIIAPNENLLTLANRLKISEYMMLEKNGLSDYTAVKAGQRIKIPTDYAAKITMLLDQKTNLPVVIKVYDDKGLFEQYEYHNLQLNPKISEAEFTRTYKDYKF